MVAVAVAMSAGVAVGRYINVPAGFWLVVVGAAVAVAAGSLTRPYLRAISSAALLAAIFALGAVRLQTAYFAVGRDDIVTYTDRSPILATLRGTIVTSPMRYRTPASVGYRRPDRTGFVLRADGALTAGRWSPATGLVRAMVGAPADGLAAGQRVELVGWMGRFRPPNNPGQFDRAAAGRANGTLVWMSIPAADGATVLSGSRRRWYLRMYWNLRAATRQHLAGLDSGPDGGGPDAGLVSAMIIGERRPSLARLNRAMARAGIAHFLSISGLHLGVFLGFVYLLCRLCMLRPRPSAAVVLVVLAGYLLLAEPRVPLLRSALMATALCAATLSGRRYSALNALSAAAVVLLAWDPGQLFSAGFQLSFAIVFGIVLLHRPVRRLVFGRWLRHRGLAVFRGEHSFRRWIRYKAGDWLIGAAVVGLTAYIAAAPLVAYHFGLFTPYAVVLSLLLFPLVAVVLIAGYTSMALLWPLPGLSYTIGRLAVWAAGLLARAVHAAGALPGLTVELRPVSPAWVAACYAVGLWIIFARRLSLGRVRIGRLLAAGGATALLGWTILAQLPTGRADVAELNLFSVGPGQCAVLRTPSGKTFIFDVGTLSAYDAARQVLRPAMLALGLPAPTTAFISHANTDHFNALPAMVRAGGIGRVYLNDYFGAAAAPSPSRADAAPAKLMELIRRRGIGVTRLRAGDAVQLDRRTRVEVLWPPAEKRDDLSVNDTSLVLRITCDDRSVLLTGDLGELGQRTLARRGRGIAADALVMPHHGGWEQSLPDFFRAVGPRVVLMSCRHFGRRGPRRADDRRSRFYKMLYSLPACWSTGKSGWLRLRFGRGRLKVTTMRQRQGHGT